MNANELADIQAFKTEELTIWERNTTATMLRQQQAEIEALKQIIDANNLNQNIGQFVKPTNEPVAWIRDGDDQLSLVRQKDDGYMVWKPLYTHSVKELTDEEIIEIGLLTTDPRFSHIESPLLLEFARAILRKAQE